MSILTDSLLHSLTTIPYQTPGFGSMCSQDPSRKCRLCMWRLDCLSKGYLCAVWHARGQIVEYQSTATQCRHHIETYRSTSPTWTFCDGSKLCILLSWLLLCESDAVLNHTECQWTHYGPCVVYGQPVYFNTRRAGCVPITRHSLAATWMSLWLTRLLFFLQ